MTVMARMFFWGQLIGKVFMMAPFQAWKARLFPAQPYRPESMARWRFSLPGSEQAVYYE
jgi:hypothetical protein